MIYFVVYLKKVAINRIHIQKVVDIRVLLVRIWQPRVGGGDKITLSELKIFKPVEEIYIHKSKEHFNLRIEKVE
jgi:hypothetical protein